MKQTRLEQMQQQMRNRFGPEQGQRIAQKMQTEYDSLCAAFSDQPKAMENHTHNNIFPVAAAFLAMMQEGVERTRAAELASDSFLELMQDSAEAIRNLMKIPGLYHAMPWLWKKLMPRMFTESAGFRFRFYPTGGNEVKFDMLECPYLQVCRKIGCPELAPIFCATDDTCYGHMHPKLIWNRTKTLARGGDLCNFDLYISSKK